jgi:hypothetical protein
MFRTGWWHNLVDVAGHVQDRQTLQRRVNSVKVVALQQEFVAAQIPTTPTASATMWFQDGEATKPRLASSKSRLSSKCSMPRKPFCGSIVNFDGIFPCLQGRGDTVN